MCNRRGKAYRKIKTIPFDLNCAADVRLSKLTSLGMTMKLNANRMTANR